MRLQDFTGQGYALSSTLKGVEVGATFTARLGGGNRGCAVEHPRDRLQVAGKDTEHIGVTCTDPNALSTDVYDELVRRQSARGSSSGTSAFNA